MDRPASKDKALNAYVDFIEAKLKKFTESPYCVPYVTLKMVVDKGNEKIRALDIDFMSPDAEDVMGAIEKFVSKAKVYSEQLEHFRNKMSPLERKEVEAKMQEDAPLAEKMALAADKKNKK